MKYRNRIDEFMTEITKDFTVKPKDPISNYRMNESVRQWMYAETTRVPRLLTEDKEEELDNMRYLLKEIPSVEEIIDTFRLDEDEEAEAEKIWNILVDHKAGKVNHWNAWSEVRRILRGTGLDVETDEVGTVEAEYIQIGSTYDATLVHDNEVEMIGFISLSDWKEQAERTYGEDHEQDEDTYIDWFDVSKYNDAEEATEAVIEMATKKKRLNLGYGPEFPEERTYEKLEEKQSDIIEIDVEIAKALEQKGYEVADYAKGIAKQKIGNRQMKIGKLLKDKPQLIKKFQERLQGQKKNVQNLSIVYSFNPRDIATMSTNRGWTSCADLDGGGPAAEQLPNKIKFGGMVAYLIKSTDKEIRDPIARIAVRRFLNEKDGSFALLAEKRCYGADVEGFAAQVEEKLDANNKLTMKTPLAIVKDAENGYSDSFGGTETLLSGKRLNDLIRKAKDGDSRPLKNHILKTWDKKSSENVTGELLNVLSMSLHSSDIESKDLVDIIMHMDKDGVISKDLPIGMIKFIEVFRSSDENYAEQLDRYIEHLGKYAKETFAKLVTSGDFERRKEVIPSRVVTEAFMNSVRKHISKDFEITPDDAKTSIIKYLTILKKNHNQFRGSDVVNKIISQVLPMLKFLPDFIETRSRMDSVTAGMMGISNVKGGYEYNSEHLKNIKKILRVLVKKMGRISVDETFSIFRGLNSHELREEFVNKEDFSKLKLTFPPNKYQMTEFFTKSVEFLDEFLDENQQDHQEVVEDFIQYSRYLKHIAPDLADEVMQEFEDGWTRPGSVKRTKKKAFNVFEKYLKDDKYWIDLADIKDEANTTPGEAVTKEDINRKDKNGADLHKKDKVKVTAGRNKGNIGYIRTTDSKETGDRLYLSKNPSLELRGGWWDKALDVELVEEEIKTESFYEDVNKAFRLLDSM